MGLTIGDRIRVTKVLPCDFNYIVVGDVGIVTDVGTDLVYVSFIKFRGMNDQDFNFLFWDGAYQLGINQVEVIKKNEEIN